MPVIKAMIDRGDLQSDIAAFYGLNSGRIAEINTGARFADLKPAEPDDLPPPGPYPAARSAVAAKAALIALRAHIDSVLAQIETWEMKEPFGHGQ